MRLKISISGWTLISTNSLTIQKTITFDEPGLMGISVPCALPPVAYDPSTHTLFVGATQVILAIDTITDTIKKVIYLGDVARALGLEVYELQYVNATGIVFSPVKQYLYISHLDFCFVSIYDLANQRFLPEIIILHGFFPTLFSYNNNLKMFSINTASDNISVIDTNLRIEEKVINLHNYIQYTKIYLPIIFNLSNNFTLPLILKKQDEGMKALINQFW